MKTMSDLAIGIALAMMAGMIIVSCNLKETEPAKEEEVVASESVMPDEDGKDATRVDPMGSPYGYDPEQTEVTFSESGETLLRFPREKKGGDYVIPSTVTSISERAFENCHELTSVVVPASVEEIGMAAFDISRKLERVVFQNHLRKLPFRCFSGCENLKELHLSDTIPPVIEKLEETEEETLLFYFDTKSLAQCTIFVPSGSLPKYQNAYGWRKFQKIVEE